MKTLAKLILTLAFLAVSNQHNLHAADGAPTWYQFYKNTNKVEDLRLLFTNTIQLGSAPYNIVGDGGVTDWYPQIIAAISNAPTYSILQFPATTGTNYIMSGTRIAIGSFFNSYQNKSLILRGHTNGTWLQSRAPNAALNHAIYVRGSSPDATINITAGATKGSTTVTVASTNGLAIGNSIWIKQVNDPAISWGYSGSGSDFTQGVLASITNMTSTTVSFNIPLAEDLTNSPTIQRAYPQQHVGIENLSITMTNKDTASSIVDLYRPKLCWVTGCTLTNFWNRGIAVSFGEQALIRSNYVGGALNPASSVYSIQVVEQSTATIVEDNIVGFASSGILVQYGAKYSFVGYNYCHETWPTNKNGNINFLAAGINEHGFGPSHNIYEGNIAGCFNKDDTWGINRMTTVYRNWFTRKDPALAVPDTISQSIKAIEVMYTNRFTWAAQNILGAPDETGSGKPYTPSGLNSAGSLTDSIATNSTNLRWVDNYTYENNTTNTWNSDTYNSPPMSLFYDVKPYWWPSQLTIPPFQATGSSKTNLMIPAWYRYHNIALPSVVTNPPPDFSTKGKFNSF